LADVCYYYFGFPIVVESSSLWRWLVGIASIDERRERKRNWNVQKRRERSLDEY
jgi:hypothetical protein